MSTHAPMTLWRLLRVGEQRQAKRHSKGTQTRLSLLDCYQMQHQVELHPDVKRALEKVGDGDVSKGIRRLVARHLDDDLTAAMEEVRALREVGWHIGVMSTPTEWVVSLRPDNETEYTAKHPDLTKAVDSAITKAQHDE